MSEAKIMQLKIKQDFSKLCGSARRWRTRAVVLVHCMPGAFAPFGYKRREKE
jgi:hypothetical protein